MADAQVTWPSVMPVPLTAGTVALVQLSPAPPESAPERMAGAEAEPAAPMRTQADADGQAICVRDDIAAPATVGRDSVVSVDPLAVPTHITNGPEAVVPRTRHSDDEGQFNPVTEVTVVPEGKES